MVTPRKAVILLSGGLDSATCLALAKRNGFQAFAMSFRYGQRHTQELELAIWQANHAKVEKHIIVDIDLRPFGGSALTDPNLLVPKSRDMETMVQSIPITYVPARNTIFLSFALGWAESLGSHDIFIGVNALDYSGYPDCRPEYIQAFQKMANLATKEGVEGTSPMTIHTPLIDMTKAQIIKLGLELGVDYSQTLSCYDPTGRKPCGDCDACLLRTKGFSENLARDPSLDL